MEKIILLGLLAASAAATPALAISRYDTRSYTCPQTQALIDQQNAVILRYPAQRTSNMTLYDRYVSDSRSCASGFYASRTYIPTKGSSSCAVYTCRTTTDLCDRP
ncbi:hypothetical protein [Rhizobium sp. RAF56]|uniref:hypothetical protein n=1 Tax=Rhizobium sp. RAF56 TaxID=3233062 RepID=UPI003F9628B7